MTTPAGWHPDPSPAAPGMPPMLRYWDGARWTEHTAPAPAAAPTYGQPTEQPQSYGQAADQLYGYQTCGAQPYGQTYGQPAGSSYPQAHQPSGQSRLTTPDGVPLAGWWSRVGAALIDELILSVVLAIAFTPFYGRVVDTFRTYIDQVDDATRTGSPTPPPTQLQSDLMPVLLEFSLIALVVSLVWTFVWLRTTQATPGKLALGLRVRQRSAPGQLPYSVIARRWGFRAVLQLAGLVPLVGVLAGLLGLVDYLWATWDGDRQTLHDKVAGTNVVRVR